MGGVVLRRDEQSSLRGRGVGLHHELQPHGPTQGLLRCVAHPYPATELSLLHPSGESLILAGACFNLHLFVQSPILVEVFLFVFNFF